MECVLLGPTLHAWNSKDTLNQVHITVTFMLPTNIAFPLFMPRPHPLKQESGNIGPVPWVSRKLWTGVMN